MEEKKYIKDNVVMYPKDIAIVYNGRCYMGINQALADKLGFDSIDSLLSATGWEVYNKESDYTEVLYSKLAEIRYYDTSSNVNCIYVNDKQFWVNKADRVGLKNLLEIQKNEGIIDTTIYILEQPFNIKVEDALDMLNKIELYAYKCYSVTQKHLNNVKKLDNIEDIQNYDITLGYPNKLKFEI